MKTAIRIRQLSKYYGAVPALLALELEIAEGEVFGILGHNGAGKTTAINILTTLLRPTSGGAAIFGVDILADPIGARRLIGYLPENVKLYGALSAIDNLRFLGRLSGLRNPDAQIAETLRFLDCEDLGPKRVGAMSKGQRQRIGLAQAVLHRPKVLFLDEPTSGLDPMGIKTLRDLILRLNREMGTTVFMNTHLLGEVAKTCTSLAVLNRGRLAFNDTIGAVMRKFGDETALEALYMSLTPGEAA